MPVPKRISIPALAALAVVLLAGAVIFAQIQGLLNGIGQTLLATPDDADVNAAQAKVIEPDAKLQSEAIALLREGELFERQGQWQKAEERYELSSNKGGGSLALGKLARIQMQRRKWKEAGATIARLKKQNRESSEASLLEGLLELRSGHAENARRMFSRQETTAAGEYGLALLAIHDGASDRAKQLLEKVTANSDPLLRENAQTLLAAYDEFALFPDGQPSHLSALLAHALAEIGECETALILITPVVQRQNNYRDAWIVKGFCEFVSERLPEALTSLDRAYNLDPEKPETQYFLARTHASLGDPRNAVTFLQYAILNGFKPEKEARELLVEYAMEFGNTQLALEQLAILAKDPQATIYAYVRAVDMALKSTGHEHDAYQLATMAKEKWPDDPQALTIMGAAAHAFGRGDEAEENLRAALAIEPTNVRALEELRKLKEIK